MSEWKNIFKTPPPTDTVILVTDGDYVGLATRVKHTIPGGDFWLSWEVPGVGGYEWDLDEPTHWQEIELPEPPKEGQ